MTENVLLDNTEMTVVETVSDDWPDAAGSTRSVRVDWKNGGPPSGDASIDLAALANQLAEVTDAVQYLILATYGV